MADALELGYRFNVLERHFVVIRPEMTPRAGPLLEPALIREGLGKFRREQREK